MAARVFTEKGIQKRVHYWMGQVIPTAAISSVSDHVTSDESSESYPFVGGVPKMGGKIGRGDGETPTTHTFQITNQEYEAELIIPYRMRRRDKTGQVEGRIREFATTVQSEHWLDLVADLLDDSKTNAAGTWLDGQNYFDTTHSYAPQDGAGSISNMISHDVTTTTAPTADEAAEALLVAAKTIRSFRDDKGRPINRNARNFTVFGPASLEPYFRKTLAQNIVIAAAGGIAENPLNASGFNFTYIGEPYLDDKSWSVEFVVVRTDAPNKAFVRQDEWMRLKKLTDGSAEDYYEDEWRWKVNASRALGWQNWQLACHVTLT